MPGVLGQVPGGGGAVPSPSGAIDGERSRWATLLGRVIGDEPKLVADAAILLTDPSSTYRVGPALARALARRVPKPVVCRAWVAAGGALIGPAGRYDFDDEADRHVVVEFMRRLNAAEVL